MPQEITHEFHSPNGVTERCIALPDMPNGVYTRKDKTKAEEFAQIDFYAEHIALCPKTWSTSPGTMVRDISRTGLSQAVYESQCKGKAVPATVDKVAVFKQSMNQNNTSGTFSMASLLYYHFSRYFDTSVKVPVALYREMDVQAHYQRVTRRGKAQATSGMIGAGWQHMATAERDPAHFAAAASLFTSDRKKVFGSLLKGKGERYGMEINGVRSSWGTVQNEEFQRTAPYSALSMDLPLLQAIDAGKRQAFRDAKIKRDTVDASAFQMMYWMKELTEIALLDFIFSQQDRVGNVDFQWQWYWVADGKVQSQDEKSKKSRRDMGSIKPPAEIAGFSPVLLQRTFLNDNDAGGRVEYANFAKKTGMLQKLRHFSADTYTRLHDLNQDLQAGGAILQYIRANFRLDDGQVNQIIKNTRLALEILHDTCSIGKLRFDLDAPKDFFLSGNVTVADSACA
jgi:hypothetical protein